MTSRLDIIVGFVSLVLIPFLGVLSIFKVRVFPYFTGLLVVWLFVGAGGIFGYTSAGLKGELPPPTPEEIQAYWTSPFTRFTLRLWITGLVIGLPLLAVTWAHEHRRLSKYVRLIRHIISIVAFLVGLWTFIKYVILPRW